MAHITEKRLREMEEEMNRFEEEISGPLAANHGRKVIRASEHSNIVASPLPPPPPPPDMLKRNVAAHSNESTVPALPPPPPPPVFAGGRPFLPPQLRHRPPGPSNNPSLASGPPRPTPTNSGPPRPGPPGFAGPQLTGGFMPPPMGMPGPFPMPPAPFPNSLPGPMPPFRPQIPPFMPSAPTSISSKQQASSAPAIVEHAKVVYSAAPVKNIITPAGDSSNSTAADKSNNESVKVAPGIELNVPAKAIEAERAQTHGALPMDASEVEKKEKKEKKKKFIRTAAGQTWEDPTLADWDNDDFRMFCGDLGNEVTDEVLTRAFSKYPSFVKAKVVRDKRTKKTKGFGFASFRDPNDFVRCMREMNGKYVGNRPIKLRKSCWRDRQIDVVRKKEKEKKKLGLR